MEWRSVDGLEWEGIYHFTLSNMGQFTSRWSFNHFIGCTFSVPEELDSTVEVGATEYPWRLIEKSTILDFLLSNASWEISSWQWRLQALSRVLFMDWAKISFLLLIFIVFSNSFSNARFAHWRMLLGGKWRYVSAQNSIKTVVVYV